jgi:hypothetical protein
MISQRSWFWSGRFLLIVFCAVSAAAAGQQNPSRSFGPGQCGPADPAYIRTANETGGVPLFLQRSEAVKAMQLMRESTRENVSTVLWASAKLNGAAQTFEIPVDSVTQRITFTFSIDRKGSRLDLRAPDGRVVVVGSPGIEDTELNCGRIITVNKPKAGSWRAEISGTGTYWLQAQVQSEISFINAQFVTPGGRPGHEGLFPISGQPIAGEPATIQVSMSAGDVKSTEFAFVSERGDILQRQALKVTDADSEFLEMTGEVELPSVPFRLAVSGLDGNGMRYQRFYGPLFHAATVQVLPKLDFDQIAPGSSRTAVFEIRNYGQARTFKITVTDTQRLVTSVEPQELSIGSRGSGSVHVVLAVPATAHKFRRDNLVVLAQSTSGPATANSAVVPIMVADPEPASPAH